MKKVYSKFVALCLSFIMVAMYPAFALAEDNTQQLVDQARYDLLIAGLEAGDAIKEMESFLGEGVSFNLAEYNENNYNAEWIDDAKQFIATALATTSDLATPNIVFQSGSASLENHAIATSLFYAGTCAEWSINRGRGTNLGDEFVYMFLSHYVDRAEFYGNNWNTMYLLDGPQLSEHPQILAKWITSEDKDVYDVYLQQSGNISRFGKYSSIFTGILSLGDNIITISNITKDMQQLNNTFTSVKAFVLGADSALTSHDVVSDFSFAKQIADNYMQQNPEKKLSVVYDQLIKDDSLFRNYNTTFRENLLKNVLCLAGSLIIDGIAGGFSFLVSGILNCTIDNYMNLFQLTAWAAMRYSIHGRFAGRMYDYLVYG